MPREYEHIRDSEVARGVDYDKAQSIAAATYNKRHPSAPMTGRSDPPKRASKKKTTAHILSYGKKKSASGIHIKPSHEGELHSDLGVSQDSKIPMSKLEEAKHSSSPAERKRATFAINASHWHHK